MNRFYGAVGYGEQTETSPGIWEEKITERNYYGDVTRIYRRTVPGESVNDSLQIDNGISILADAYAYENFCNIRYVTWMGIKWAVSGVEVQQPRMILTLGGKYNGPAEVKP